jgi:hypothetical protein
VSLGKRGRVIIASIAVVAVVAVSAGTYAMTRSDGKSEAAREREHSGSHEMREALEKHPALGNHRLPLAFVSEKLAQSGGEASGEIKNGPSQEAYDQRALPRKTIASAQQKGAARAFGKARSRSATAEGRSVQRTAAGAAAVPAWTSAGPNGGIQVEEATYTGTPAFVSGRTTSLLPGHTCRTTGCVLYAGTAGGGLWKTSNALATHPTWTHIGSDIPSTAIGTLYRAPNDGGFFVGTGEPNGSSDSEAGLGLYKSTDGARNFRKVQTFANGKDFTLDRSVAAVAVDPANAKHILVGTAVARHGSSSVNGGRFTPPGAAKVGLYETRNGGATWQLTLSQDSDEVDPSSPNGADFFRGGISKIKFDPTHQGMAYVAMFDYGLFRESPAGSFQQIYTIKTPGDPATGLDNRVEFATATLPGGKTRIYLGDGTFYGPDDDGNFAAALFRSDDGTTANPTFKLLSDPTPGTPGYGSYNFCQGQCSYDMNVASPPGRPDEVFLSGAMNYDELQAFGGPGSSNGRSIVRSADAGVHVTDMTNDGKVHSNGLHPDQHALVFVRTGQGKQVFFSSSDGGIWRQEGPYVNRSSDCGARGLVGPERVDCEQYLSAIPSLNQSLNKGLQTLQFQSASVTPGAAGIIQGGTQDNGTWESDDEDGFAETVGGDGGQSGFNVGNSQIRYHSYFNPQHDVSFDGGSPRGWDWISDPLLNSGEASSFYTPFTADPTVPGTVFDGLQHIWRTTDNGGPRAYLDRHCNEISGDFDAPCGDWKPMGGKGAGDLSGGDPGNYVVAVERAPSNDNTLWAGTRRGRIYVSTNANAANPTAVTYRRYDTRLGLPQRFPSGISVDPARPNHAFISYSGYSAYSPGGHVYEVTVNPTTGSGTAKDLSGNLGDQPITDVVQVPSTGSLYASTDFGVVTRTAGSSNWVATSGLPKVAVYGLTLDRSNQTLYAATHGRSIWKLPAG